MKPWEYFTWLRDLNYTHSGFNADYNIQKIDNALYVSFQQTSGWFDWVLNILFIPALVMLPFAIRKSFLQPVFLIIAIIQIVIMIVFIIKYFPKRPYKNMKDVWKVHFGMAIIYGSIRDEIIENVKKFVDNGGTKIYVGGWSQGGGVSQLCAEDIYYQFQIKPILTTFGSLRVGWGKKAWNHIADSVEKESICYENGSDIVPHLPLRIWGFKNLLGVHIGEKFNLFKIFNTPKYHSAYGDSALYTSEE